MSAILYSPPGLRDRGLARIDRLRWALTDVRVLTWRTLARIAATPEQILNVTVLPLVFVLLFSYVFNGAIVLPGNGNYRDYLIAGIFAVNMGGTAQGAAIGLAVDLSSGLIDRFRSLPMSRAAVIVGRTLADLITTLLGATVTVLAGVAVGWRIHAGPAGLLLALVLALLFGYSAAWAGACVGLPVVAVDAYALGELVRHGDNGFLARPGHAAEVAAYLDLLHRDPGLRARMSAASLRIIGRHERHRLLADWESLYHMLASTGTGDR